MENHGHRVICVPAEADAPKIRLLECAHLERIGNRGVDGTIFRFVPLFVLDRAKTLPQFQVGQYFLVARVSGKGKRRKLSSIWTGPWRVPTNDQKLVYVEKHLVIAELSEVLVVWMRVYADDHLEITGELLKVSQQLENQSEHHIRSISAINRATSGDEFVVKVVWEGLEDV